jgi:ribosomal-protein-alanine N-acetyltransferase
VLDGPPVAERRIDVSDPGSASTGPDSVPVEPRYSMARLAHDDDLDQVVALETASFSRPWTREALVRELQPGEVTRVYVARSEDPRVVAFCACWFIVDELHITTLAVDPAHRRRGLATSLLRFVFQEAHANGVRRATLDVRRSNVAALRLYGRLGFQVSAVRPNYYTHPEEDGLVLWQEDLAAALADSAP